MGCCGSKCCHSDVIVTGETLPSTGDELRAYLKKHDKVYDMKPAEGPILEGCSLQCFACCVRGSCGGSIIKSLLDKNGFEELTAFVARIPQPDPLFVPYQRPSDEVLQRHKAIADSTKRHTTMDGHIPSWATNSCIADLHRAFLSGEITPADNMKRILADIEKSNTDDKDDSGVPLNAFWYVDTKGAMKAADESTARYQVGKPLSILDGIPFATKGETTCKGMPWTWGARARGDVVGKEDAQPVRFLKEKGGAISVGITRMHEIGMGTSGFTAEGSARNPHNRRHITGGSSSGSAAAVASGAVLIAIAHDGGGSTRIPAGLCGVPGLKATFSRVNCALSNGAPEDSIAYSVAHPGPICPTIDDTRIAYEVMAQHPSEEFTQPVPSFEKYTETKSLAGLRVGIFREWNADAKPTMRGIAEQVEGKLKALGAEIVEIKIPFLRPLFLAHVTTIVAEMASAYASKYPISDLDPETEITMRSLGMSLPAHYYVGAQVVRRWFTQVVMKEYVFAPKEKGGVDAILTPNTSSVAHEAAPEPIGRINLQETRDRMTFMLPGNMIGLAAVTVPIDLCSESHLPRSVQFYADHWQEGVVMRLAKAVEPDAVLKPKINYYYAPPSAAEAPPPAAPIDTEPTAETVAAASVSPMSPAVPAATAAAATSDAAVPAATAAAPSASPAAAPAATEDSKKAE